MFGFLSAPCGCCSAEARSIYQGHFCGLCNVMCKEFGFPTRLLINCDSTFLYLLTSAQNQQLSPPTMTTCCNPFGKQRPLYQSAQSARLVAAVTIAGLNMKLRDDFADADERWAKRMGLVCVKRVFSNAHSKAERLLRKQQFPWDKTIGLFAQQEMREAAFEQGHKRFQFVAEPTAAAYGIILQNTGVWSGVPANGEHLYRLGYALGTLVYLADCWEDREQDERQGQFNPLLNMHYRGGMSWDAIHDEFVTLSQDSLQLIISAFHALRLYRFESLLKPILAGGIARKLGAVMHLQSSVILDEQGAGSTKAAVEDERKRKKKRAKNKNKERCCDACDCCCECPCPVSGCLHCGSCDKWHGVSDSGCCECCSGCDGCDCCSVCDCS